MRNDRVMLKRHQNDSWGNWFRLPVREFWHHRLEAYATVLLLLVGTAAMAQDVPRYSMVERSFETTGQYDNPYIQVQADAVLTLPDASTRSLPLFWDGGRTWKLRISPHVIGSWSYVVRSDDDGLNGQTGTIQCVESSLVGGIEPMKDYSNHFQRQDGSPFLFWGDTAWGLYLDKADEQLDRESVQRYIDQRSKQGINVIHAMLLSETGWGNSGGDAFDDLKAERLNPEYWREIDSRLKYLNQKGVVGGLVLAWAFKGSNPLSRQDFPSMDSRHRYIRYVAARYGAYDTFWILAGEWNLSEKDPDKLEVLRQQYSQMGQWLAEANAHGRMIGIHPGFGTTREFDPTDWTTFGDYQQNYPNLHQQIVQSRDEVSGPVVNSEYGYLYRDVNSDGIVDKHNSFGAEDMRHATWDIVMGGGYPVTGYASTYMGGYRDKGPFNVDEPKNEEWGLQYHLAQHFLTTLDWWKLKPQAAWITSKTERTGDRMEKVPYGKKGTRNVTRPPHTTYWLLADPGRHYVAYCRGMAGAMTINLGPEGKGEYRARLYDPRTGQMRPVDGKEQLNDVFQWTPPDDEDWVLHLINLSSTSPPGGHSRPDHGELSQTWQSPDRQLAETIVLDGPQPSDAERLRIVEGGEFVDGGWKPRGKLDRMILELERGFAADVSGAIELDMTSLDFDAQVTGKKHHFFSLYSDPTGDQFNLRNAFFTLRGGRYRNDQGHRGIKVLWRGDYHRGEHAPYAARPKWDPSRKYTWRGEWNTKQLVIKLDGQRVFGPAEFGDRDQGRPLAHVFLSRDGSLAENVWFGFPGPVYQEIRTYRE